MPYRRKRKLIIKASRGLERNNEMVFDEKKELIKKVILHLGFPSCSGLALFLSYVPPDPSLRLVIKARRRKIKPVYMH